MELDALFKKWKLNKKAIAERLGLTAGGFHNKLSNKNADKLTENQKEELRLMLKEMANDINSTVI